MGKLDEPYNQIFEEERMKYEKFREIKKRVLQMPYEQKMAMLASIVEDLSANYEQVSKCGGEQAENSDMEDFFRLAKKLNLPQEDEWTAEELFKRD